MIVIREEDIHNNLFHSTEYGQTVVEMHAVKEILVGSIQQRISFFPMLLEAERL